MIRLALLRHGHTAWNRAGRIQGRSDIPLDDAARAELRALRLPAAWNRAALWSSPLMRARQTAEILTGKSPVTDPALTEMNWGKWEGCRGRALADDPDAGFRHIEDWGWDFRPPGGESVREVQDRVTGWLTDLRSDSVAVCHIGIMRVILARAHGWDFAGPPPFRIKRNRLYTMTLEGPTLCADPDPVRLVPREPMP